MAKKKTLTHAEAEARIMKAATDAGIRPGFEDANAPMSRVIQGFRDAKKAQRKEEAKQAK